MNRRCRIAMFGTVMSAVAVQAGHAQQVALNTAPADTPKLAAADAPKLAAADAAEIAPAPAPVASGQIGHGLDRWLDLKSFDYGARYRSVFCYNGARSFDQGQQKLTAGGKFKFDSEGKYGIGFHLSSGRYFNWAYADFIGGGQHQFVDNVRIKSSPIAAYLLGGPKGHKIFPTGFFNSGGGQLYLRQAFLTAEPVHGIEAQFGGIAIKHGVNTEATSYDDDGYMAGERISVHRPKQLYFSDISYTRGYMGDFYTPNFFVRGDRLAVSNYWQILAEKDFGHRIEVSADDSMQHPDGFPKLHTTREAILADTHESRVFDTVRFEAYQRLDGAVAPGPGGGIPFPAAKGYGITVARRLAKRASVEAGVVDIDNFYIVYLGAYNGAAGVLGLALNGDQYGSGERYFARPTIKLNDYLSLSGYYSHVFNTKPANTIEQIWNAQALTAGIAIDAKRLFFPPRNH